MTICDYDACTGCGMCSNICGKEAISMIEDKHGFFHPKIDKAKCIECGLCSTKCPANNRYNTESMQKVYACWTKNKKLRKNSTSGGIFSTIAKEIINKNGIVIGCAWDEDFSTHHICVDCEDALYKLRGSKYVQSKTKDIYKKTKQLLDSGKKVLFSGTPCQVHALKLFLGKEYEGLFTIDLVCHGVPPYQLFKKHIDEISKGKTDNIAHVFLRYKKPSWLFGSVRVEYKDGSRYMQPTVKDAYFNLFNFNYSLRMSCHKCSYTNMQRTGDITLCDFWGFYPRSMRLFRYDKGVSAAIINSPKGEELFEKIKSGIKYDNDSIERVTVGNKSLYQPFQAPNDHDKFWFDVTNGMSISELNKKYVKKPYKIPPLLKLRVLKSQIKWIIDGVRI